MKLVAITSLIILVAWHPCYGEDPSKVDAAKLYREAKRLEAKVASQIEEIATLRQQLAESENKRVEMEGTRDVMRRMLAKLAKIEDRFISYLSDADILAIANQSSNREALLLDVRIKWCIDNNTMTVGMTPDQVTKALTRKAATARGTKTGANDDGTENWIWDVTESRSISRGLAVFNELYVIEQWAVKIKDGKVLSFDKR